MAESADAEDLKSSDPEGLCGFKSRSRHQFLQNPHTDCERVLIFGYVQSAVGISRLLVQSNLAGNFVQGWNIRSELTVCCPPRVRGGHPQGWLGVGPYPRVTGALLEHTRPDEKPPPAMSPRPANGSTLQEQTSVPNITARIPCSSNDSISCDRSSATRLTPGKTWKTYREGQRAMGLSFLGSVRYRQSGAE